MLEIDVEFVRLLSDKEVDKVVSALESRSNHISLTDEVEREIENDLIKQAVLNHITTFSNLMEKVRGAFSIKKFLLNVSAKYDFYCFVDTISCSREIIHGLIVTDKKNKILGIIRIK